jgi:hypothetical protein
MIPLFVAFTIFSVVVNTISFSDLPATTAGCNPSYNAEASQYVNVPHSLVADDAHVINYKSSSADDVSVVQDAVITDHSLTYGALDRSLPLVLASQGSSSSIYQINLYWFKAFVLMDIADSVNELAVGFQFHVPTILTNYPSNAEYFDASFLVDANFVSKWMTFKANLPDQQISVEIPLTRPVAVAAAQVNELPS